MNIKDKIYFREKIKGFMRQFPRFRAEFKALLLEVDMDYDEVSFNKKTESLVEKVKFQYNKHNNLIKKGN